MTRSEIMWRVRSTGNKSTEWRFRAALIRAGVTGWRVQPDVEGRPDVAFPDAKVAVFLDGCFWHGCERHFRAPRTRRIFWLKKIHANRRRGADALQALLRRGWKVFRVWEHDIANAALLGDIVLRVARAADTPDSDEAALKLALYAETEAEALFHCADCGGRTTHYKRNLTSSGAYVETVCAECCRKARRVNGRALL